MFKPLHIEYLDYDIRMGIPVTKGPLSLREIHSLGNKVIYIIREIFFPLLLIFHVYPDLSPVLFHDYIAGTAQWDEIICKFLITSV